MPSSVSRLFHAVVVVGASLTACGDAPETADPAPDPAAPGHPVPVPAPAPALEVLEDASVVDDAGADAGADGGATSASAAEPDAEGDAAPTTSMRRATRRRPPPPPEPSATRSDACPPGSERPFPPCYWIL